MGFQKLKVKNALEKLWGKGLNIFIHKV